MRHWITATQGGGARQQRRTQQTPNAANAATLTLEGSGGGLPVLHADDGQTHLPLLIDVGVVDLCLEGDLWGLEGVLCGEDDLDPERSFVVRRTVLEGERLLGR